MTREEKQDNCMVVIQVPLKQKPGPSRSKGPLHVMSLSPCQLSSMCIVLFVSAAARCVSATFNNTLCLCYHLLFLYFGVCV